MSPAAHAESCCRFRRVIHCLDSDPNALAYAKTLLGERSGDELVFHADNALKLLNVGRNQSRFGAWTTIYSAGLFDYLPDAALSRLLAALYASLALNGVLIAPCKDAACYETFDYHWVVRWNQFFQRTETDFRKIFLDAGIPESKTAVKRDDSGVILFFIMRR